MPAQPTSFEAWASELATLLRDREVAVPVGALITFVAALGEVGARASDRPRCRTRHPPAKP